MPQHDLAEYVDESVVLELVDADVVKVAGEPLSDGVAPTTWWTHGTHKLKQYEKAFKYEGRMTYKLL